MHKRLPQARELANSSAKMAIIYRTGGGQRLFEVSPGAFATLLSLAGLLIVLYGAGTGYLLFKDDLLRATLSSQARMQYAYEDRIAQLRAQVDRVASRQLVDQDTVESKLHELISRQVQLESRQAQIARLADDAAQIGIKPAEPRTAAPTRQPDPTPTGSVVPFRTFPSNAPQPGFALPKGKPQPEGVTRAPEPLDELRLDKVSLLGPPADRRRLPNTLDEAQATARLLAARQIAVLRDIEQAASASARRFRTVLDQTGLNPDRFAKALTVPAAPAPAIGGPLVPITNPEAAAFEKSLLAARTHLLTSDRYSRVVRTLPLRRPLSKDYETTSGFGPRVDPFTRGLAMHTGLDFRAATGTPIRATADGKVTEAGWNGGYGRMVEIDHGFGITTRYAHMSAMEVAAGDTIKRGQVIGYVGSSGRSTGPHLHYEVRIDEDAADPATFLRAGEKARE